MSKFASLVLVLLQALLPFAASFARDDFPREFVFGAGTSAYQYEGAVAEDGRSPGIWDTFTKQGKMPDGGSGDVTADGYHKFKEDIKLMSDTGLEAYRISISWSRLIPNGRGAVNPKGLEYYNSVIDGLVQNGMEPHVTLIHLDYPQVLEDEYGGWLSPKIVDDFTAFADVCFREFGDRVGRWTTFNEANVVVSAAYDYGFFPPARCSPPFGLTKCDSGNSTVEAYIAMHNVLLAHASAVRLYRAKYKAAQKGLVGFNIYSMWLVPYTDSPEDAEATQRAFEFTVGWSLKPLIYGDYPKVMRELVGSRLPSFSQEESSLLKGTLEFVGLNHYVTLYVQDIVRSNASLRDYAADMSVGFTFSRDITPIPGYIPVDVPAEPVGLEKMLEYLKREYGNPLIYVQENGLGIPADSSDTIDDALRIDAIRAYLSSVLSALRKGSRVRGYFVWSFMDVFEFLRGYKSRFGLYYVDFDDDNRRRSPKASALWYRDFLKNNKTAICRDKAGSNATLHTSI